MNLYKNSYKLQFNFFFHNILLKPMKDIDFHYLKMSALNDNLFFLSMKKEVYKKFYIQKYSGIR